MSLVCIGHQHAFNKTELRDYHRVATPQPKWLKCKHYLCPQRYQRIKVETALGSPYTKTTQTQESTVKETYKDILGVSFPEILPTNEPRSPVTPTHRTPVLPPVESEKVEPEGEEESESDENADPHEDTDNQSEHADTITKQRKRESNVPVWRSRV